MWYNVYVTPVHLSIYCTSAPHLFLLCSTSAWQVLPTAVHTRRGWPAKPTRHWTMRAVGPAASSSTYSLAGWTNGFCYVLLGKLMGKPCFCCHQICRFRGETLLTVNQIPQVMDHKMPRRIQKRASFADAIHSGSVTWASWRDPKWAHPSIPGEDWLVGEVWFRTLANQTVPIFKLQSVIDLTGRQSWGGPLAFWYSNILIGNHHIWWENHHWIQYHLSDWSLQASSTGRCVIPQRSLIILIGTWSQVLNLVQSWHFNKQARSANTNHLGDGSENWVPKNVGLAFKKLPKSTFGGPFKPFKPTHALSTSATSAEPSPVCFRWSRWHWSPSRCRPSCIEWYSFHPSVIQRAHDRSMQHESMDPNPQTSNDPNSWAPRIWDIQTACLLGWTILEEA